MPTYIPLTGAYFELGSGATGQIGRVSTNLNKVAYDTGGFVYVLKSNGEGTSRAASFAPTILDLTNTTSRGQVCIQPAANRLHEFVGCWADSVGASSSAASGSDLQWVLIRGSASAAPLQSGTSHSNSGTGSALICLAASDSFAGAVMASSDWSDIYHGRVAYVVGATLASTVTTANVWVSAALGRF